MRMPWRIPFLLGALVMVLYFGFYPIYGVNLAEPTIEWRTNGTASISQSNTAIPDRIDGDGIAGLQAGDVVLRTNGGALRRWDFYFPWGLTPGDPSQWILQRGAIVYSAEFDYRPPTISEQARLSLRPLVALLAWAFGSLLLVRVNFRNGVARRVGWVAIGYAILLVALFAKNLVTPLSYVVVGVLTPLTSAGYLDLALVSDYEGSLPSVRPGWRWLLFALAIVLAMVCVIDAIALQPFHALDTWTPLNLENLMSVILMTVFVVVPVILVLRASLERRPRPRAQLRVIATGTVLGIVPTLVLIWLSSPDEDILRAFLRDAYLLTLPMISLLPLSYCYAALRHQYLELDRFAQHAIGLIIALFATWLLYALTVVIMQGIMPAPQAALPAGLVSGLLAVTVVFQNQDQVQALTRRLLFGTSENPAVQAARVTMPFRAPSSRARVEHALTEGICQELGITRCWLVVAPTGERNKLVSWPEDTQTDAPPSIDDQLSVVTSTMIAGVSRHWPCTIEPSWASVVVPVGQQAATFRGWLILGEKTDGTAYNTRDLAVVEIVADEAAVRLDNLLHEEAGRRATARQLLREMRVKRILMNMLHAAPVQFARELHEELQKLMTQLSVPGDALRPATEDARSLEESLRNVMAVLGSRLLHLGLPFVLEDVLERFGATYPMILTEADVQIGQAEAIPTLVSMVIFQGVQEALLNVARHSQARRAVLSATYREGHLIVAVDDDGVGLPKEFDLPMLVAQGHDGLVGMIELVRSCGGQCHLERSPLGGLRVSLVFRDDDLRAIADDDLVDIVTSDPVFEPPMT